MSLRIKFNIVMLTAFVAGLALAAVALNRLSQKAAQQAVLSQAGLMMAQAEATLHYTDAQVSPLFLHSMGVQFMPQSIPFYAARQTTDRVTAAFPEYSFRVPATNPTNPDDRPAGWEADIIKTLVSQPKLNSLVTERTTPTGQILSLSRPVRIDNKDCLACHSTPDTAPPTMIDVYGKQGGFGWKLGSTVGAEIVSVPERVPFQQARRNLYAAMGSLTIVFAVMLILLNLMLHVLIIKPARRLSALADEISLGNMNVPEFDVSGTDEISSLSRSFNRMRRSLTAAVRLLEE
jgi:protein-histidine pros-kinase